MLLSLHIISSLTDISEQIFHLNARLVKSIYKKVNFCKTKEGMINSTFSFKLKYI